MWSLEMLVYLNEKAQREWDESQKEKEQKDKETRAA